MRYVTIMPVLVQRPLKKWKCVLLRICVLKSVHQEKLLIKIASVNAQIHVNQANGVIQIHVNVNAMDQYAMVYVPRPISVVKKGIHVTKDLSVMEIMNVSVPKEEIQRMMAHVVRQAKKYVVEYALINVKLQKAVIIICKNVPAEKNAIAMVGAMNVAQMNIAVVKLVKKTIHALSVQQICPKKINLELAVQRKSMRLKMMNVVLRD